MRQAGGQTLVEYWIPAEDLEDFNRHIIGTIEVVAEVRQCLTGGGRTRPREQKVQVLPSSRRGVWMTIALPPSKTGTTICSRRDLVSNPSRTSGSGGPSPSRGSTHSDPYAAWIGSSEATLCLSAWVDLYAGSFASAARIASDPLRGAPWCARIRGCCPLRGHGDRLDAEGVRRWSTPMTQALIKRWWNWGSPSSRPRAQLFPRGSASSH